MFAIACKQSHPPQVKTTKPFVSLVPLFVSKRFVRFDTKVDNSGWYVHGFFT
jgi:hypothetical protein